MSYHPETNYFLKKAFDRDPQQPKTYETEYGSQGLVGIITSVDPQLSFIGFEERSLSSSFVDSISLEDQARYTIDPATVKVGDVFVIKEPNSPATILKREKALTLFDKTILENVRDLLAGIRSEEDEEAIDYRHYSQFL